MPNTDGPFNPGYSTIKAIYLANDAGLRGTGSNQEKLNILIQNTECVFERLELVENINDVVPNGVVVVRDIKDIASRLKLFEIDSVRILFFDGSYWDLSITSVSYINNAASDTEENFVGIYVSNKYYKKVQNNTLSQLLGLKQPSVYLINDFVSEVKKVFFDTTNGYLDETFNYVLYRPLNPIDSRIEEVSDNAIQYLNYLASYAVDSANKLPQFMFWTSLSGDVNFKFFKRDGGRDPSYRTIDRDVRRIAVFDGDSVVQQLSDGLIYRKCYFYNTNPAYQFISKKYYYIRKTPKILDTTPTGVSFDNYIYSGLIYQFQDEGQKYNISVVGLDGTTFAVPGADQLIYNGHWGYYDGLESVNDASYLTHLGQNFGTEKSFSNLFLMGSSGYMPFADTTEMWKNMFDMTEIHPNYPNSSSRISGNSTNLQKVMNIRYKSFLQAGACASSRLEQFRNIELQNFVMYSLCCMGKRVGEESFFAVLTKFEEDNAITQPNNPDGKIYRYQWNKIKFNSKYNENGPVGSTGYNFHQLEKWSFDALASSTAQDDTWAINTNERGLTASYLPAGWISPAPSGFKLRPIGANTDTVGATGEIFHIVKMNKIPLEQLLSESGNEVYKKYIGKYLYYFDAENVLDGICESTG